MGLSHATPQANTPRTPPSLQVNRSSLKTVKKVFLIVMENHNWTGNNSGAASGDPDLKSNPLATYVNGELLQTSAHAEQYFNPPGNHPSQTNYLWLEAGSNFGVLADTQPGQPQLFTHRHLVRLLQDVRSPETSAEALCSAAGRLRCGARGRGVAALCAAACVLL